MKLNTSLTRGLSLFTNNPSLEGGPLNIQGVKLEK